MPQKILSLTNDILYQVVTAEVILRKEDCIGESEID